MTDAEWARIDKIPGWLTRTEAELLHDLAATPWCEIGSWAGRSANALAHNGPGYCVDHWNGSPLHSLELNAEGVYEKFLANTKGLPVTALRGHYAERAADVPDGIRLLFIDHDHQTAPTREAWDLYSPKVAVGGHVVFHDAEPWGGWPEVAGVVEQVARQKGWERLPDVDRCAVLRRT